VPLEGLGLVGTIPSALFGLPDLIELNLEVNQLEGQLPDPLCSDNTKLEVTWLSWLAQTVITSLVH
jgi:hypothetical protein